MADRGTGPPERKFDEDAPTHVDALGEDRPPGIPSVAPSATAIDNAPLSQRGTLAGGSRGSSAPSGSSSRSLVTARETLVLQEIHRTRAFLRVAIGLAVTQGAALFLLGGYRPAKIALAASLVVVVIVCGRVLVHLRDDDGYTVARGLGAAYSTIFAVYCGIYFYGVFSPAAVIVPLGVQFYCAGESGRASFGVFATCALAYAGLTALVLCGVLPDAGFVRALDVPLLDRAVMVVMTEVVFLAVYLVARRTRAATLLAIERHDLVVKSLAQRDALLREARHDLAQAIRVGGAGRYSGEVVGPFRVGSVIGRGAMGEVYDAVHTDSGKEVAIKLVHPPLLAERDVVERFLREAKLTSSLSAANVVAVIDASPPDAPIPYLAMERLHGEDLAAYLSGHKRVGMSRLCAMLRQVATGLDAAHAAGIVHRDLKPRNLFCVRSPGGDGASDEVWKILDFGVSGLSSGEGTLTRGQIIGTPAYMAPEQARAEPVGPRADIFALAVIAYRALTGRPPFSGDTSLEILYRVSHEMPPRPGDIVNVPEEVDLVLAVGLAKNPADRFASASDLSRALEAAASGKIEPLLAARARALLAALPWGA